MQSINLFGTKITPFFPKSHSVCRLSAPVEYGERLHVPRGKVRWKTEFPGYLENRKLYVDPKVIANYPNGWAHSANPLDEAGRIRSYGELTFNSEGYPMNPVGRTGFGPERGLLGHWGGNFAADPMITWVDPRGNSLKLLVIERKDTGKIALPGGMDEYGHTVGGTLNKELAEETGVKSLDMEKGSLIFCGYVDDPRNSDHAWMETVVVHRHVDHIMADSWSLEAGDDAVGVFAVTISNAFLDSMYSTHGKFVRLGLKLFKKNNPQFRLQVEKALV